MEFTKKDVEKLNIRDIIALSEMMVPEDEIDYYDYSVSPLELEPFLYNIEQRATFFYCLADEIKLLRSNDEINVVEIFKTGGELAASKIILPDDTKYVLDSIGMESLAEGKDLSGYVNALKEHDYYGRIYSGEILHGVINESLKEMGRFEDFETGAEMINGMVNSPLYKKLDLIQLQAYRDNMLIYFFDRAKSRLAEEIDFDQKVDYNEIVDLENEIR